MLTYRCGCFTSARIFIEARCFLCAYREFLAPGYTRVCPVSLTVLAVARPLVNRTAPQPVHSFTGAALHAKSEGDCNKNKPEYDYKEKEAEHVKKEKIILSFPGLIWESLNCRIKSDNDGESVLDRGIHKGDIRVTPEYDREKTTSAMTVLYLSFPCLTRESVREIPGTCCARG